MCEIEGMCEINESVPELGRGQAQIQQIRRALREHNGFNQTC